MQAGRRSFAEPVASPKYESVDVEPGAGAPDEPGASAGVKPVVRIVKPLDFAPYPAEPPPMTLPVPGNVLRGTAESTHAGLCMRSDISCMGDEASGRDMSGIVPLMLTLP